MLARFSSAQRSTQIPHRCASMSTMNTGRRFGTLQRNTRRRREPKTTGSLASLKMALLLRKSKRNDSLQILFRMPSGTSSSDEDREVDVTGGTTPPPGGKLPTLNENDGGDDCMGGSTNSIAGILPFDANDVHMEIKQEAHSPEDMSSPAMNGFGQFICFIKAKLLFRPKQ